MAEKNGSERDLEIDVMKESAKQSGERPGSTTAGGVCDHTHLTTQKSFYVEISRARTRAELVTDSREGLREHLESATGDRIAAPDAVEPESDWSPEYPMSVERAPG